MLISTPYIRECIEIKERTKYIREQIALGTSQYGMQTFDQSLYSHCTRRGDHAGGGACCRASNPDEFRSSSRASSSPPTQAREQMESTLEMGRGGAGSDDRGISV